MNALLLEGAPILDGQAGIEDTSSDLYGQPEPDPTLQNSGDAVITLTNGLTGTEALDTDGNLVFIPTADLRESIAIPDWVDGGPSVRRFASLTFPELIVKGWRKLPPEVRGLHKPGEVSPIPAVRGATSHLGEAALNVGLGWNGLWHYAQPRGSVFGVFNPAQPGWWEHK